MKLPDLLATRARLAPHRIALRDTGSGVEYDYAGLDELVARTAGRLRDEYRIGPGDRVATVSGNRAELIALLFGCARLGAILAPLNRRLAPAELDVVLADCDPALVVTDAANAGRGGDRPRLDLDAAPLAGPEHRTVDDWGLRADEDCWYLIYTSGTTGRPKAVINTYGMALANHLNIGTAIGLTAADTTLTALPMFHTGGINLYTLPTLIAGGTAVLLRDFDPAVALATLADGVTAFFGVPTMYQRLADHPGFADTELSGVRSWASGGAALDVGLLRRLADAGIVVRQGMGMTETGPTLFLLDEADALSKAGSVGKPQVLAEVRLVDGANTAAAHGELQIRGPGVTPGYWRRPDATAEAFTADGWLRSGDIARRDADGHYWIAGRIKDMYISGGENVFPAEVETVLLDRPEVAEAAVVGVPDERWGETGLAVVVPTGDRWDLAALRAHCRAELAGYKVPGHLAVVDALPRNGSGKVVKDELTPVGWQDTAVLGQSDIDGYARLSGDDNPVHVDPRSPAAAAFGGTIAHGGLVFGLIRSAIRRHHPGRELADTRLAFRAPTRPDAPIRLTGWLVADRHLTVVATDPSGAVACEFTGSLR